jgi:Cu(I)/Ag(I) efflux system protein CusF
MSKRFQWLLAISLIATSYAVFAADPGKPSATSAVQSPVHATGVVKAVDVAAGTVVIAHHPIKALGWPAMTMMFKVDKPALLQHVSVGNNVNFTLRSKTDQTVTSLKVKP